jgi:hypothetical protein
VNWQAARGVRYGYIPKKKLYVAQTVDALPGPFNAPPRT